MVWLPERREIYCPIVVFAQQIAAVKRFGPAAEVDWGFHLLNVLENLRVSLSAARLREMSIPENEEVFITAQKIYRGVLERNRPLLFGTRRLREN